MNRFIIKQLLKTFKKPLLASLIVLTYSAHSAAQTTPAPTVVETAEVSYQQNDDISSLPGTVISTRDAKISAEVPGRLSWVAKVGDTIEKGQPLATIDDYPLRLQLRNDQAQIDRIKVDLQYDRRQQDRLKTLRLKNSIAQSELDQTESKIAASAQDLRIAEINRDKTQYDISRSTVVAPFTGLVAERSMVEGEYTQQGDNLVRLVDTNSLELSVNAPLRIARFNRSGTQVNIEADTRSVLTTIRGAVPIGDQRSRMMELRLSLQADQWYIGEAVTVKLLNSTPKKTLNIPRDALVLRENVVYVYRVDADNKAKRITVETGSGNGANISVEGDLKIGDKVVIRGAERLKEGQTLKLINQGTTETASSKNPDLKTAAI